MICTSCFFEYNKNYRKFMRDKGIDLEGGSEPEPPSPRVPPPGPNLKRKKSFVRPFELGYNKHGAIKRGVVRQLHPEHKARRMTQKLSTMKTDLSAVVNDEGGVKNLLRKAALDVRRMTRAVKTFHTQAQVINTQAQVIRQMVKFIPDDEGPDDEGEKTNDTHKKSANGPNAGLKTLEKETEKPIQRSKRKRRRKKKTKLRAKTTRSVEMFSLNKANRYSGPSVSMQLHLEDRIKVQTKAKEQYQEIVRLVEAGIGPSDPQAALDILAKKFIINRPIAKKKIKSTALRPAASVRYAKVHRPHRKHKANTSKIPTGSAKFPNNTTIRNATQGSRPAVAARKVHSMRPPLSGDHWSRHYDTVSGHYYNYNAITGTSIWEESNGQQVTGKTTNTQIHIIHDKTVRSEKKPYKKKHAEEDTFAVHLPSLTKALQL